MRRFFSIFLLLYSFDIFTQIPENISTNIVPPDTIFNFGWSKEPLYIEINYNGRLNLKISLDTSESEDVRREIINQQISECKQLPFSITPTLHPCGKIKGSKTIASFDVGLIPNEDGNLECQPSIDVVKQRIYSVVNTFYGRKPSGT